MHLHAEAQDVLDVMTRSGKFDSEDLRSLEHVILGFLREPAPALGGLARTPGTIEAPGMPVSERGGC